MLDLGEGGVAVARCKQVAHAAAPAGGGAFGRGRLPVGLLVVVRKQLGRQRHRACLVLRQRGGLHQRADVQQHRHLSGVEQGRERVQARRQRILPAARQRGARLQQVGREHAAVDAQVAAQRILRVVAGLVVGHQRIGVVVAAEQEDAHQRLVVRGGLGRCLAHGRQRQGPGRGAARDGQRRGALQEDAARSVVGLDA